MVKRKVIAPADASAILGDMRTGSKLTGVARPDQAIVRNGAKEPCVVDLAVFIGDECDTRPMQPPRDSRLKAVHLSARRRG